MTDTFAFASAAQLWRLNACGLLELRDDPGEPLERTEAKEVLVAAAAEGLWTPKVRGERGEHPWDSAVS